MTADAEEPAVWRQEDPRTLLSLACTGRPGRDRGETWKAVRAARNAGTPWPQIAGKLLALAFRSAGSSPPELRDEKIRLHPASPPGAAVHERGAAPSSELPRNRARRSGGAA